MIPVFGVIVHRAGMVTEWSGGTSAAELAAKVRAAVDDPSVDRIVLDVDSPGGTVAGVIEAADVIFNARRSKPITAIANAQAGSAAYWLASQASDLAVTPSGMVGSIGVYVLHQDESRYLEQQGIRMTYVHAGQFKVEGNSFEPLGAEARREWQARVDEVYAEFVGAVARGRGRSVAQVKEHFGRGRMLRADGAQRAGMVDRVATLEDVLRDATTGRSPAPQQARAAVTVPTSNHAAARRASDEIALRRARLAAL